MFHSIDGEFGTTVRFKTDDWHGKAIMHCHILQHEDHGLMGFANIVEEPSGTCNHDCSNSGCPKRVCKCPRKRKRRRSRAKYGKWL